MPEYQTSAPRVIRVLNLGAGVQSTTLQLMFDAGMIAPRVNCSIFADTQDEPGAEQRRLGLPDPEGSVYSHLDWLQTRPGREDAPILVRTRGKLSDDLMRGENSTRQRFASIPAYTLRPDGDEGQTRRQCSMEYKIEVINRTIRRELCGAAPGRTIPKGTTVIQYIGISADEAQRAVKVMRNGLPKNKALRLQSRKWGYAELKAFFAGRNWRFEFPLVDHGVTRQHCIEFLKTKVPHVTPRSACVECPFHDDIEWDRLRREDPLGFARAVQIDHALRVPGNIVNRNMDQPMFLHRSCKPLDQVLFNIEPATGKKAQYQLFGPSKFANECLGVCGI